MVDRNFPPLRRYVYQQLHKAPNCWPVVRESIGNSWISQKESVIQKAFSSQHDDVIKWKHFPRYWPFVRGIHRSPVNSPYKGQWRGALMFSLICVWINGWANDGEVGDLRRYRAHHDVTVMRRHRASEHFDFSRTFWYTHKNPMSEMSS